MTEDELIDDAVSKVSEYGITTGTFYEPFRDVWPAVHLVGIEKLEALQSSFQEAILSRLHMAWNRSNTQVDEFKQEERKKSNVEPVFDKYWQFYSEVVEKYHPFEYWYDELWPYPNRPDSAKLVDGLWGQLFNLCYDKNLPFEVGLLLVERVFSANLTLAKLNLMRSATVPDILKKARPPQPDLSDYKSFSELFINPDDIAPCVQALNNYEKSRNREGALNKFSVIAWIDHLSRIDKIRSCKFDCVGPVLAKEFEGWSVSRSSWYKPGDGYEEAKKHFTMEILP